MYIYIYIYICICIKTYIVFVPVGHARREAGARDADGLDDASAAELLLGWHYLSYRYLSNAASFVLYGITCLTRLIEFAV